MSWGKRVALIALGVGFGGLAEVAFHHEMIIWTDILLASAVISVLGGFGVLRK
jgi:hypothetical protein